MGTLSWSRDTGTIPTLATQAETDLDSSFANPSKGRACPSRRIANGGRRRMKPSARSLTSQTLVAVVVAMFCGQLAPAGGAPAAAPTDIAIGVVLPISGREAKPGQYQREGIE